MLMFLQAAISVAPAPVHVIVDRVPEGMSELAKTLIAAGVGALFGILSSIGMEYLKPWIAALQLKRTIRPQLIAEVKRLLPYAEGAQKSLENVSADKEERRDNAFAAYLKLAGAVSDRYEVYREQHKIIVSEIDIDGNFEQFHGFLASAKRASEIRDFNSLQYSIRQVVKVGHTIMEAFR